MRPRWMQNVKLTALVLFKLSLPKIWIIGVLFPASFPNEINILKLEQLNRKIAICIWWRPDWIWDGKLETFDYFCFSGCCFSGSGFRIPNFFKCLKYLLYPQMASRLWQYLFRAKSKTKNLELFVLYPCFISSIWLPNG